MATNTYVALDKKTVSSNVSFVEFTSIPQTYTDLILEINVISTSTAGNYIYLQYNGDTSSNYSTTIMSGTGSSFPSTRFANRTNFNIDYFATPNTEIGTRSVQIMNYSNTTTNKTGLVRADRAGGGTDAMVGLWRSTAAITSIKVTHDTAQFAPGTTFSLYGIKASTNNEATPKATGGYVSSDSTYWYHAFPYSGTFTPSESLTADVLVVAGGGSALVGGGGAGGLRAISGVSCTATGYTITVGAGGVSSTGYPYYYSANGTNSSALSYSATGGGGSGYTDLNPGAGFSGGSGGGGGGDGARTNAGGNGNAGGYTPVEGYNGGSSVSTAAPYVGGGGGGAGGSGQTAPAYNSPGNGGIGATSTLINAMGQATGLGVRSGSVWYFAGGGAGGTADSVAGSPTQATGGLGGGGNTATSTTQNGGNGVSATGGGGGARYGNAGAASIGGKGGSGVVIIRYAK